MMPARGLLPALLAAAAFWAVAACGGVLPFAQDNPSFEHALVAREFEFPRDHAAHPTFAHEWWYLTGHLAAPSGERFGFELTFFRVALGGDARAVQPDASHWRAQQLYVAHFAVTDIGRGHFIFQERFARDALGLSGAEAAPLKVWVQDWTLAGQGASWQIQAATQGYALDVQMMADRAPVANGERGLSQKSSDPGDASYYYSIPRLTVHGHLLRDGQSLEVSGSAWLDREWGSGGLGADEAGWDWFALQLADGSDLMFYSLRRRDGSMDPLSGGTWVAADGKVRRLGSGEVTIRVQGRWESPRGGRYPARWRLEVPSLGLAVNLRPVLADQELVGRPRYWEGAVDVSGTSPGGNISGEGYVELVGYARAP
jgi:predicted secreted hydrolase